MRAFVICAALVCLCVSDGVGPRLIPYASSHQSAKRPETIGSSNTRRDAPAADPQARNPEEAKAADGLKKVPVFSAPDFTAGGVGYVDGETDDPNQPPFTPGPVGRRPGRAPPTPA